MTSRAEQVCRDLGIEGDLRGDEFVACCPAHSVRTGREDGDPSWSLNVQREVFHCFSCGWSGTLGTLLGFFGQDPDELDVVQSDTQVRAQARQLLDRLDRLDAPAVRPLFDSSYDLSEFVVPPREALHSRDLTVEVAQDFPVLWDERNEAWVFPLFRGDDCVGWQIKGHTTRMFRNFPYGLTKSRYLYGTQFLARFYPSGQRVPIVIVESPLDAARITSYGHYFAVASMGASVSAQQIAALTAYDTKVICMLDSDAAGHAGAVKVKALADKRGVNMFFVRYPDKFSGDPGDLAIEQVHALLADAVWSQYLTDDLTGFSDLYLLEP